MKKYTSLIFVAIIVFIGTLNILDAIIPPEFQIASAKHYWGVSLDLDNLDPTTTVQFVAPPVYDIWWKEIASCSGLQISYNLTRSVTWHYIKADYFIPIQDPTHQQDIGLTHIDRNTIYVIQSSVYSRPLIEHEMLHVLLAANGYYALHPTDMHPSEYFGYKNKCGVA
jgi:hypothetical protein